MSLLDLTQRNVRRNFRLYTIYLLSMIIGVIIHFTFSSLMYNEDILAALENRDNFRTGVTIASVVMFLFIIFFILYANSFFMRQRKKEFGMYLLYGMNERQITLMVFYETLMVGAVSLATGILLGGLLSKLFGMLLMNLMQYDQAISLAFPLQAIGSTVGVFLLLAVIISVQSYFMIGRVQLVELFHAKEKMEKPIASSPMLALLSVLLLGTAFGLIASGKGSVYWQEYAGASLIACAVGIVGGTYLFFRQFAGWLLQRISRRKSYAVGNTVLWTSSLRFQIRGNTLNLTFISLFSAAVIMLMCFVTINYSVQFKAAGFNLPNDIAFESRNDATNGRIDELIKSSAHPIKYHRTVEAVVAEPVRQELMDAAFENPEYYTPYVLLVSEQTYNGIVALRGDKQSVDLSGEEAVSLSQGTDFAEVYEAGQRVTMPAAAGTRQVELSLAEKKDYAFLGWSTDPVTSMERKPAVIVVSDELYRELRDGAEKRSFEIYQVENARNAEELSRQVHAIVQATPEAYYSSFADVYSKQIESSSLMLFAAGFLALIALFALASVIYFKQLREATEAQAQYAILRKMGVGDREVRSVIRKQLLFVFLPPLAIGFLVSWLIIKSYILDSVKDFPGLGGLVWGILGIYCLIYFLLYMSSTNLYFKIVSQR
ncbi:ABC transporter permease [Paenibacillus sp. N4]|uniref:ABC transporter permease n=1 Tax=Paenibacillus vietnamensis TaxID=2590547 RepID=UPI001CD0D032|nr:ABC transporter permease [Paenibacillus vietnamensis]MCA0758457.1 ABC transporter permease [Paenibacillus vietnamensis]